MSRDEKKQKPAKAEPKKTKRPRTDYCIHRRKPEEFCSRCDGKES